MSIEKTIYKDLQSWSCSASVQKHLKGLVRWLPSILYVKISGIDIRDDVMNWRVFNLRYAQASHQTR
jgi:hypothetical protein